MKHLQSGVDMSDIDVLKERIDGLEKRIDILFSGVKESTALAREVVDRRLEQMNEVREQLREQAVTFVGRNAYDVTVAAMDKRIRDLEAQSSRMIGIGLVVIILIGLASAYLK